VIARARKPPQLSINQERWLVSYADFITLLFAFFVVMYSVSHVSETKFRVLSDTLIDVFNEPKKSLNPIQIGEPTLAVEAAVVELSSQSSDSNGEQGAFDRHSQLPSANSQIASGSDVHTDAEAKFNDVEQAIENRFANLLSEDVMKLEDKEYWLEVTINANLLFGPASAEPSYAAETVFDELASILSPFTNSIGIEGFTDSQPINTSVFPSNWELSSARAAAAVQLMAQGGVDPKRLSATGFAQFKPIADNNTASGRAKNRRVVVKIEKPRYQAMLERDQAYRAFQARKQAILEDASLSAVEKNTALLKLGVAPKDPSLRQALAQTQDIKLSSSSQPSEEALLEANDIEQALAPVRLNDGDLLFTNDPE
jgi:chemotaxis protein MotB